MYNQGQIIGERYLIEEVLHSGNHQTYKAIDTKNYNSNVVLKKILLSGTDSDNKKKELFSREQDVLSKLKHSQIPILIECDEKENYFVENFIEGNTLSNKLKEEPNLINSEKSLILFIEQILRILDYIHGENYVHRDVKPDNIILSLTKKTYLIDFGSVGFIHQDTSDLYEENICIGEKTLIGTQGYAPEEQFIGKQPHPSFDIYAVGIIALEIITGSKPTSLPRDEDYIKQWNYIWEDDSHISISENLKQVIQKMANDDSEKRYQSVIDTLKDLLDILRFNPDPKTELKSTNDYQEWSLDNLIKKHDFQQFLEFNHFHKLLFLENEILKNHRCESFWLLIIYDKILKKGRILSDDSEEQQELLRLNLVKIDPNLNDNIIISEPIYKDFFNEEWVRVKLSLSGVPYANQFRSWLDSNRQNETYLLGDRELLRVLTCIKNYHHNIREEEEDFLLDSLNLNNHKLGNNLEIDNSQIGRFFHDMESELLDNQNFDYFWLLLMYYQVLCKPLNLGKSVIPQKEHCLEELQQMCFIKSDFQVYKYVESIFDIEWVQTRLLENERPYANKFADWIISNRDDTFLLAKGQEEWKNAKNYASSIHIPNMHSLEHEYLLSVLLSNN